MDVNTKMKDILKEIRGLPKTKLPKSLDSIINEGFVESDGALLLNVFWDKKTRYNQRLHFDLTGFECFINHHHFRGKVSKIESMILFSLNVLNLFKTLKRNDVLKVILEKTQRETTFRCYLERSDEPDYLVEDLNEYNTPLMILRSDREYASPDAQVMQNWLAGL